MADDVFALSPISARAVQPSEADYDAIRDAFLETSRGRWFLGEYAKRNRNADTSMVLDAVARIEEALAAQRQVPAPDDRLFEVLAAIRDSVDRATEAASAAFDSATLEASLAPIRKAIVIIREISWRWREIGADGRICDLIDSQLDAIEAGCGQIAAIDPHAALSASFDMIRTTLAQFIEDEVAAQPVEDMDAAPESDWREQPGQTQHEAIGTDDIAAEPTKLQRSLQEPAPEAIAVGHAQAAVDAAAFSEQDTIDGDVVEEDVIEAAMRAPDMPAEVAVTEAAARAVHTAEASDVMAEAAGADAQANADAQAHAHDEAVLELVAAEMAAPDPIDIDDYSDSIADDIIVTMRPREPAEREPIERESIEREPIERESVETLPEPDPAPVRPPIVQPFPQAAQAASLPPSPSPVIARGPSAPVEPSLGSTIIANGILQPAKPPANDPLAPIRRMSQAEKIAFFS